MRPAREARGWCGRDRSTAERFLALVLFLFFLIIVLAGYVSGILHKLFYNLDWVVVLYALNGAMVMVDILLYCRNAAYDRQTLPAG